MSSCSNDAHHLSIRLVNALVVQKIVVVARLSSKASKRNEMWVVKLEFGTEINPKIRVLDAKTRIYTRMKIGMWNERQRGGLVQKLTLK